MTGSGAARPELEPDLYSRLGVERTATDRELAAAYRRAARRHHPDKGGSQAAFAAVEEAYRVLRAADSRSAYDARLRLDASEPCVDWENVGWGVSVDEAEPATEPAATPGPGGESGPVSRWRARRRPRDLRGGPNPFSPGAVALPLVDPGPFPLPPVPAWFTVATACAAGATGIAILATGLMLGIGTDWFLLLWMSPLYPVFLFLFVRPRPLGRTRALLPLWVPLGRALFDPGLAPGTVVVFLELIALLLLAGTAERLRFLHKHSAFRVQRIAGQRRAEMLHRRLLAAEWNRAREALRAPGSRAVLAGVVAGPDGGDSGVDRRCWDPLLGAPVVLRLPTSAAQGRWLVVDAAGTVLACVPHGSPEAWHAELASAAPVGARPRP